jgi:ubiquinol-cytochrome c reductase cytochrome b/c1 subunit
LLVARVATAYYFIHFLIILPVLGYKERTIPLPLSIMKPVLGGSLNLEGVKKKETLN